MQAKRIIADRMVHRIEHVLRSFFYSKQQKSNVGYVIAGCCCCLELII